MFFFLSLFVYFYYFKPLHLSLRSGRKSFMLIFNIINYCCDYCFYTYFYVVAASGNGFTSQASCCTKGVRQAVKGKEVVAKTKTACYKDFRSVASKQDPSCEIMRRICCFKAELKQACTRAEAYAKLVGIYLLKVNNRNTRTRCEICSKLTIKTPERRYQRRSGVFIVNFEHISHLVLVFLLLTLSR